jgi:hypothetical protein
MSISDVPDTNNKVRFVARQDTWSRGARRKARAREANSSAWGEEIEDGEKEEGGNMQPVILVAHVWIEEATSESDVQLVVQWKQGKDEQVFESFATHVGRKVREATEVAT